MNRIGKILLLVALVLILTPAVALAQGGAGGQVIFGRDFIVRTDEHRAGDLVLVEADLTVEQGGILEGDVIVVNGTASIDGRIDGDLLIVTGDAVLGSTAVIAGDIGVFSGRLDRDPRAVIEGNLLDRTQARKMLRALRDEASRPGPSLDARFGRGGLLGIFLSFLQRVFSIAVLMAVGVLAVLVFPEHTSLVGRIALNRPFPSLGVGFLAAIGIAVVTPILMILCIGIPVAVVLLLGLVVAALMGWSGLGLVVGKRVLEGLGGSDLSPLAMVAAGMLTLGILSAVPCLGFLASVVLTLWGLGAVLLTRFGTQPYPAQPEPAPVVGTPSAVRGDEAEPLAEEELMPERDADDLTQIAGIGPVFAERLNAAGVRTFAGLARLSPDAVAGLVEGATAERVAQEDWIGQAEDRIEPAQVSRGEEDQTSESE